MAQIRWQSSERAVPESGSRASRQSSTILAFLRLQDVPLPVLIALIVLLVGACVACWALWRSVAVPEAIVERAGFELASEEEAATNGSETVKTDAATEGGGNGEAGDAESVVEHASAKLIKVDVDGAVAAPGVYELAEGSRVLDAVQKAGGLVEGADTLQINLAQVIIDGQKIVVPHAGEETSTAGAPSSQLATTTSSALVNINTADLATLDTLPGVGEATAQAIIDDRASNGPFASIEDLMRVSGIGEKKFARLQALICV